MSKTLCQPLTTEDMHSVLVIVDYRKQLVYITNKKTRQNEIISLSKIFITPVFIYEGICDQK